MMRMAILGAVLALSACNQGKTDERDTAAGKILPGSVSDAMLQTDGLQAEAPLAAPVPEDAEGEAKPKAARAGAEAERSDAEETPEAAQPAAPAPTPTAAATQAPSPDA